MTDTTPRYEWWGTTEAKRHLPEPSTQRWWLVSLALVAATGIGIILSAPTSVPVANLTASQQHAVRVATSHLDGTSYSRQGLIEQLSAPHGQQFAVADATVAVDSLRIDWNAQAARSAAAHVGTNGFTCQELIDRLSSEHGEQFTPEQARFGAAHVGVC